MKTENQVKREKLMAKIRALLSMTEANGCTEAEAIAAGFCTRINDRFKEMKAARDHANGVGLGRSLVVVKNQVVTEKYAKYLRDNDIRLSNGRSGAAAGHAGAFQAGQVAGGRADLGGGKVGGGQLRIGR